MRPETKERADTIMWLCAESLIYILPGDSWRYGDVGGAGAERSGAGGAVRQQAPKKKKEMSWFSACKHLSQAEIISPVEMGIEGEEPGPTLFGEKLHQSIF